MEHVVPRPEDTEKNSKRKRLRRGRGNDNSLEEWKTKQRKNRSFVGNLRGFALAENGVELVSGTFYALRQNQISCGSSVVGFARSHVGLFSGATVVLYGVAVAGCAAAIISMFTSFF